MVFKLFLFSREQVIVWFHSFKHSPSQLISLLSSHLSLSMCLSLCQQRQCCITTYTNAQQSTWGTPGCMRTLSGCVTPSPEPVSDKETGYRHYNTEHHHVLHWILDYFSILHLHSLTLLNKAIWLMMIFTGKRMRQSLAVCINWFFVAKRADQGKCSVVLIWIECVNPCGLCKSIRLVYRVQHIERRSRVCLCSDIDYLF